MLAPSQQKEQPVETNPPNEPTDKDFKVTTMNTHMDLMNDGNLSWLVETIKMNQM